MVPPRRRAAREESLALCTAEGTAGRKPKLQSREKLLARCTGLGERRLALASSHGQHPSTAVYTKQGGSLPKTGGGAKRKTFSSVPFGSVQAASSPPSMRIAKSSQTSRHYMLSNISDGTQSTVQPQPHSTKITKTPQATPAPREWPQRTRRFLDLDGLLPLLLLASSSRRLRP